MAGLRPLEASVEVRILSRQLDKFIELKTEESLLKLIVYKLTSVLGDSIEKCKIR